MARRIRYHEQFQQDLADRVKWLARHRGSEQLANLQQALRSFNRRVPAFPPAA